jgi:hypothetical protein
LGAASIANKKDDAFFSMAIRTAQVEIVQQMLKSGTKVTAVVEPVSCLSFAMQQYLCRLHLCNMYHLHDALPAVHQSVVQALLYILMLHSPHPAVRFMMPAYRLLRFGVPELLQQKF